MTISTDLEAEIRSALALCLQRHRTEPNPAWVSEAAGRIMLAARKAGDVTAQALQTAGMAADDVAQAVQAAEHGLSAMDHAGAHELAAEMRATFTKGSNGWSARVPAARVDDWDRRIAEAEHQAGA